MNKELIIETAVKAGMHIDILTLGRNVELLEAFAKLVVKHEREQCATLCDELDKKYWQETGELMSGYGDAIREMDRP